MRLVLRLDAAARARSQHRHRQTFNPWPVDAAPQWHCTGFDLVYCGSAALCRRDGVPRRQHCAGRDGNRPDSRRAGAVGTLMHSI